MHEALFRLRLNYSEGHMWSRHIQKKFFEIILLENPSQSNAKADISKQENAVGVPQIRNMRFKLKT